MIRHFVICVVAVEFVLVVNGCRSRTTSVDIASNLAVNCIWAQWGAWGRCSKTCGDAGSKQRTRGKKQVEKNGGTCDGQPTETEQDCAYDWGTNGCPPQHDNILYIGGKRDTQYNNGSYMSSVDFKSINSNKTCHIKSLDYELACHASAVTPIGVITCGGMSTEYEERKKCFRLSKQNTWESFPSMNNDHNSCFNSILSFQMIVLGDILVAIDSNYPIVEQNYLSIEKINWRVGDKWESIDMSSFDRNIISFDGSCITKWSEEEIIIIGGKNPWETNKTWIMNIATMKVKPGPSLNTARYNHGCARIRDDSIIVAGGLGKMIWANPSELLIIGDLEWNNGPDTEESAFENRIVMSNLKDYVALSLGGTGLSDGPTSKIYGLSQNWNDWQFLGNVSGHRYWGSVVNVPSNMIPWCYN